MDISQRAGHIASFGWGSGSAAKGAIEMLVQEAIAEEREACAKILDEEAQQHSGFSTVGANVRGCCMRLAAAIRARSPTSSPAP